jgi:hypothetical protein
MSDKIRKVKEHIVKEYSYIKKDKVKKESNSLKNIKPAKFRPTL